jgi:hypothetical protein
MGVTGASGPAAADGAGDGRKGDSQRTMSALHPFRREPAI